MKASIIITNYNYQDYIARCIRSCLNQSIENYEVIIVDDCSTDNSLNAIKPYLKDEKITLIKNKKNLGVAGSANEGIKVAKGKFVVRVDSDDFISHDFLRFLIFFLEDNKDAFCVSCDYTFTDNNGKKLERVNYSENPISCGVMYRKDLLVKLGMYNKKFKHREEEELRARLGNLYKIKHLNVSLYRYRKHGKNKTTQSDLMTLYKKKLEKKYFNNKKKTKRKTIIAIIPARKGSKRLKNKNIRMVWGKPMIYWAIKAAKKSKYIESVYVTTDCPKIEKITKSLKINLIKRPAKLAQDDTYKMDAIKHAVQEIMRDKIIPSIVVSVQANSPELKSETIDKSIDKLIKNKRSEIVTVDKNFSQNGALRTMLLNTVFEKNLSTNLGVILSNETDIHTIEDLKKVNKKKN